MFDHLIRKAFPVLYEAIFKELNAIRQSQSVLETALRRIENQPPRQSRRVYVTLRGFYTYDKREEEAHGWTIAADIDENDGCIIPFQPYCEFRTERVDILGPAVITGINVGNEAQNHPHFETPATFEFRTVCQVGNVVTVYLKGTP